ncbi:MAG TPA: hypothetical protein VFZ69_16275 [Longimicrobiales bacterium]
MMTQAAPPSRAPAIIGFLIAGALLVAASMLADSRDDTAGDVPALEIVRPATGDSVANPVSLEFRTPAPLHLDDAMGWAADDLHLHAMVGDREVMPAAADIQPRGDGFLWRLPMLEPGTHRIHLTWAGRHHGNLRGPADTITVHVRD